MPNNPGQPASSIMNWIAERYNQLVLGRPLLVLILLLSLFSFFAYQARDFRLDASSDSLLLENDQDLRVYREVINRYEAKSFLVLTFTPETDLFEDKTLERITNLKKDLEDLPGVESVFSLVDVPLVKNVDGRLTDLEANLRMLSQDGVDKDRAREELLNSPLFKELIISADGGTTALRVELRSDSEFETLRKQRDQLVQQRQIEPLSAEDQAALSAILLQYDSAKKRRDDLRHQTIESVREIMDSYRNNAKLYLGGVPMIADDMITYIKSDLVVFGVGVFVLLVAMLGIIFRRARWVLLPLASCVFSALLMIGVLGLAGWRVTVISSTVPPRRPTSRPRAPKVSALPMR